MPLFKCAKCGCCENTALGLYWTRDDPFNHFDWSEIGEEWRGKPLCSECAPPHFKDGQPTGYGQWHNHFKKEPYENVIKE